MISSDGGLIEMNKRASAKYIAVMGLACFANYFGLLVHVCAV